MRHEGLERRAAALAVQGHARLLSARRAGPVPVQRAAAPNRTGLPDGLKAGVETLSGVAMDDVRVHYGSPEPARLGALAYAQGTDIHLAPGQDGHLPHEAWHVAQQAQGRVRPTRQMKSGPGINDDEGLEREADAMGARAESQRPAGTEALAAGAGGSRAALRPLSDGSSPVQGRFVYDNEKIMSSRAYDKIKRALEEDPTLVSFTKEGAFDAGAVPFSQWLSGAANGMASNDVMEHVTAIYAVDEARSEDAVDPVEKIKKTDVTALTPVSLSGSRSKIVFLFKADGEPTAKKNEARYAIDTQMDKGEYDQLRKVEGFGLRIPAMYGMHPKGVILEWIGDHGTVGGGGARPLVPVIKQMMGLDAMLKRPFGALKWARTLQDVNKLIAVGFTSKDLQFMVDNVSGRIYMMDFDNQNIPSFGTPDKRLTDLKPFLEEALATGGTSALAQTQTGFGGSSSEANKKPKLDVRK